MGIKIFEKTIQLDDKPYSVKATCYDDSGNRYRIVIPEDVIVDKTGWINWNLSDLVDFVRQNTAPIEAYVFAFVTDYSGRKNSSGGMRGPLPNDSSIVVHSLRPGPFGAGKENRPHNGGP